MKPGEYQDVKRIMGEVMDLDPAGRNEVLQRECAGRPAMRAHIESLLAHLDDPAVDFEVAREDLVLAMERDFTRAIQIPGYRIIEVLGEGGMGVVYLAEQTRPHRRVALKVIRPERMSPEALARFEREANVLGLLHHPGIAHVFEVGNTETAFGSSPFIAMEYIDGPPLLDYVRDAGMSTRQRLELMIRVCQAVHHAHEHGVVHRDLKPSNILVRVAHTSGGDSTATTLEAAQPKVLDFGVARLVDDGRSATLRTEPGQLLGTVAYMSPEQIGRDPFAVDRRSDVYALGVIMCEMLAGRLPYSLEGVSLPEVGRVILTEDPTLPGAYDNSLRGDIDTLVGKALEKDPERRYATAEGLALDIRRFLDDEPIIARPPSTLYQLRKFSRRHRALVFGTAAVFLALLTGLIVALAATFEAQRQRDVAGREAAIARAINDFLVDDVLAQADPHHETDRDIRLRTVLDRAALRIGDSLDEDPIVRASIQHALAQTYFRLGLFEETVEQVTRATTVFGTEFGPGDERTLEALILLSGAYWSLDRLDDAIETSELALTSARRELGPTHERTLGALNSLAVGLKRKGDWDRAETLYLETIAGWRTYPEERPELAAVLGNLGVLYSQSERYDEAEDAHLEALAIRKRQLGEEHPDTVWTMVNLGDVYWGTRRNDEAAELWDRAYAIRLDTLGEDHPDTLMALHALGLLATARRDHLEAERIHRDVLARRRIALGDTHRDTLVTRVALANALWSQGRLEEAAPIHSDVYERRLDQLGAEHPMTRQSVGNLSGVLNQLAWDLLTREPDDDRDPVAVLPLAERAAALSERRNPGILDTLATALFDNDRVDEAVATEREALELLADDDPNRPAYVETLERFLEG